MAAQRTIQSILLVLAGVVALLFVGRGLVAFTGDNPIIGQFSAEAARGGCPQTDNCVSSLTDEQPWAIEPLACQATGIEAASVVHDAVLALSDVEVMTAGERYVVRSRLLRFPDDLLFQQSSRGIEVLSSSRLGAGDMGVNRSRVETLRVTIEGDPRC